MKIIKKVKKFFSAIGLFFITLSSKVFALTTDDIVNIQAAYGVPQYSPSISDKIWWGCKIFVIPIALLIGLIGYFKKSKNSNLKKILVTIGIIVITAILYFVVNKIIYELL